MNILFLYEEFSNYIQTSKMNSPAKQLICPEPSQRPEIYELQVNFISINTQHYTCDCYEVSELGLEAFLRLIARIEE